MYFKEHAIRELETVICSIIRKCPDKFITLNKFPVKDAYLKCSGLCKAILFPSLELHKVCYPIIQGLINKGRIHRKMMVDYIYLMSICVRKIQKVLQ